MSGNLCLTTNMTDYYSILDALEIEFPKLAENREDWQNPKNGNFAPDADHPIRGVSDMADKKVLVRVPKQYIGTSYDMGLACDPNTGLWEMILWEYDAERQQKKIQKIKETYGNVEWDQRLSQFGGTKIGGADVKPVSSLPANIQEKLAGEMCTIQEVHFDTDFLEKNKGIEVIIE